MAKREKNDGLRKVCGCPRRAWTKKCDHPWHFNFKWNGIPYRFSMDSARAQTFAPIDRRIRSKTEASAAADVLRAAIRNRKAGDSPKLPQLTVGQLFTTYRTRYLLPNRAKTTIDATTSQIALIGRVELLAVDATRRPFSAWLVADVTTDTIAQFEEARRPKGVPATNRDLSLLRSMFNWAIRMGLMERTPFKRGTETVIKLAREAKRSRRLNPETDEAGRLLAACGPHLRAIVEAALETGCRKGELLSLQWWQVRWTPKAELFLPAAKTKTRRDRRIPISARLKLLLDMRKLDPKGDEHKPEAYVFGNEVGEAVGGFKRAWTRAVLRAHGIKPRYVVKGEGDQAVQTAHLTAETRAELRAINLHFHDLRREAGSRWLEGGVPLHTVRDWLGHANISQTSTYLEGTISGQHDAMAAFDAKRGALQPDATESQTGGNQTAPTGTMPDSEAPEGSTKHQTH